MADSVSLSIVNDALAVRRSHPKAPALDVLDLVIRGRGVWLEDFLDHMVPPSPFALLVAEAVCDLSPKAEWIALTGHNADEKVRAAMQQVYAENVWPRFIRRYGLSAPSDEPKVKWGPPRWW